MTSWCSCEIEQVESNNFEDRDHSRSYDGDYNALLVYPPSIFDIRLSSLQPQAQLYPHDCGYLNSCSSSYLPLESQPLEYNDLALSPLVPSGEKDIVCCEICNANISTRRKTQAHRWLNLIEGINPLEGIDYHNKRGCIYGHDDPGALPPWWASARDVHVHMCHKTDAQHEKETGPDGHDCETEWSVIHISNASPSQMTRMFQNYGMSEPVNENLKSNRPYGIIYMHKPRWSYTLISVFYTVFELALCLALRNYELCQSVATPDCESFATSEFCLDKIWAFLYKILRLKQIALDTSFFRHEPTPSTLLFVCLALMYGAAVINHYRLRRRDAYQYLTIPVGIIASLCILATSANSSDESPKMVSTFAFCIAVANMLSVCVHSIWRTLISPPRIRLQRKIEEWMHQSDLEVGQPRKGVRFHEIN